MKIQEAIAIIPRAAWKFLKAIYHSIADNLTMGNGEARSFDKVYDRITRCKACKARRNDTCRVCGCNCFIKCALDNTCPIWQAIATSDIYPPTDNDERGAIIDATVISTDGSGEMTTVGVIVSYDMRKKPYIVYKRADGLYKKIIVHF